MTTFVDPSQQAASSAAQEAESRGRAPKLENLKSQDFAKGPRSKLGRPTRFVPPVQGMTLPWITYKRHEIRDPYIKGSRMISSWACPKAHGGKRCLLCEMEEAVGDRDPDLSYMLRVKDRHLALDLTIEGGAPVLKKFEFGATVYKQLLALIADRNLNFSSLTKGFPLDIMFNGKADPKEMWKADRPDDTSPRPIDQDIIEQIMAMYPAGGLTSLLFTPDAAWQYKQFVSGTLRTIDLPWGRIENLPELEDEETATHTETRGAPASAASSGARRGGSSARSVTPAEMAVGADDDIPF